LAGSRRTLKGYEGINLIVFLLVLAGLGVFVALVFQYYGKPDREPKAEKGVLSTATIPGSDGCMFYVGTELSQAKLRYASEKEIKATDDGFVQELFEIPGVVEVVVDHSLVVLHKSPGARWEPIQPAAREVINKHLHLHR
jgi:hypothetical protein